MDRFTDKPKKELGQYWLNDEATLEAICNYAELKTDDTVLEVGPGTGSLTKKILETGAQVVAVEKDEELAAQLRGLRVRPVDSTGRTRRGQLEVIAGDILRFDLTRLPSGFKVVANIPYYLTSNLLRLLSEVANPPSLMILLVQKEVAERIAAKSGQMSLLSVSVQLYYQPELGKVVPAKLFSPPPKVDSQVVILRRHRSPLFKNLNSQNFFRLVKAGFSERRKKLRSSLAGGLGISKEEADSLLNRANISPDARAQELSLEQWFRLSEHFQ
ncbi:ribosomal RNA small subunit methyltransferase A [Candidatus Saccharibacteria bacterium RIFCSPHIGHO2_12_FULL_47_16b]|nr:MAG: ribosomal RNA small subunit methyltransferase A [Candidatus Saccharibacteria bacterium RIFCSPHIGHO2_12_FULL_47_16b]